MNINGAGQSIKVQNKLKQMPDYFPHIVSMSYLLFYFPPGN
jgi:hypothetical protein